MNKFALTGLACLSTACGVALALPTSAANLVNSDYCADLSNSCDSVSTELAIVLDGSNSITSAEFTQLKAIYRDVFSSPTFYDEIVAPLAIPRIAVSVIQFGYIPTTNTLVEQSIQWWTIDSQTSATAFANQFLSISQMGGDRSPLGNAIQYATNSLRSNDIAGDYLIMDMASDGYEYLSTVSWSEATIEAYSTQKIDAINAISVDPDNRPGIIPDGVSPVLSNIVSLINIGGNPLIPSNPTAQWKNTSNTVGFQSITGTYSQYRQFLANKIARETLPPNIYDPNTNYLNPNPTTSVPESSVVWGLMTLAALGISQKIWNKK